MLFTTKRFAPLLKNCQRSPACTLPLLSPSPVSWKETPFLPGRHRGSQSSQPLPQCRALSVGGQEALPSRPQMMISEHKEEPHTHCDGLTGAELWPWGFWLYFPTAFRVFLKMNHVHKKEKKKKTVSNCPMDGRSQTEHSQIKKIRLWKHSSGGRAAVWIQKVWCKTSQWVFLTSFPEIS